MGDEPNRPRTEKAGPNSKTKVVDEENGVKGSLWGISLAQAAIVPSKIIRTRPHCPPRCGRDSPLETEKKRGPSGSGKKKATVSLSGGRSTGISAEGEVPGKYRNVSRGATENQRNLPREKITVKPVTWMNRRKAGRRSARAGERSALGERKEIKDQNL